MSFSIASITFLVGLALIVIAVLGGGIEVKEIKLPVLGIFPRMLSFATGTVLLALSVFWPAIQTPTATLSASTTSIIAGQSSTLTWSSANAAGCNGTNFTPNGTSGSMAVTPSDTTIYSITCAGAGGVSPAAHATVTVTASPRKPVPTATLSASTTSIIAGQSSTLTWSSANAAGCNGTNFRPNGTSGSMAVTPSDTTIYSITCAGAGGVSPTASATVMVTAPVRPDAGEIETLWRQNDSVMLLSTQGENVAIRYLEPTDFIMSTGVVSGDLKFKGKKTGNNYRGNGYIHTINCPKGFAYEMSGSESGDHKIIILDGSSPRIDAKRCRIVDFEGTSGRHLEFTRAYDLEAAGKLTSFQRGIRTDSIH